MAISQPDSWTEAAYLAFEETSDIRHEFTDGVLVAMTGGSWNHNLICVNTSTTLNMQLADTDCRVTSNDMRLKVAARVSYRYPDVMVICGVPQFHTDRVDTITNPTVVIEVLSASTALTDRNDKLGEYLQIPSVREYGLISQHETKIERYLRQPSGNWLYTQVSDPTGSIDLPSLGCTLALADVYRKVTLEPPNAAIESQPEHEID